MHINPDHPTRKRLTKEDVRASRLHKEPYHLLPNTWTGTVLDILDRETLSAADRLWIVLHAQTSVIADKRLLRTFAIWCARQALSLLDNPDPCAAKACDMAERYANGQATEEELLSAHNQVYALHTIECNAVENRSDPDDPPDYTVAGAYSAILAATGADEGVCFAHTRATRTFLSRYHAKTQDEIYETAGKDQIAYLRKLLTETQ